MATRILRTLITDMLTRTRTAIPITDMAIRIMATGPLHTGVVGIGMTTAIMADGDGATVISGGNTIAGSF